jgi:hypothetical protein
MPSDAPHYTLFDPRNWMSWAQHFSQPINPGWSFGNISITHQNSANPDIEHKIVETLSYGRQIGRIMDALGVIIDRTDTAGFTPDQRAAFAGFAEIRDKVAAIKREASTRRVSEAAVAELAQQLESLKKTDHVAYEKLAAILRASLSK